MLTRRIIACLDVRDGVVVKGVGFRNHQVVGGIEELAMRYADAGADELVFYDITASSDQRSVDRTWVGRISRMLTIPFCVAGGIRSVAMAESVLNEGADKISINSPALEEPKLISDIADQYGSQCVVVGIDSAPRLGMPSGYQVFQYTGSDKTIRSTGLDTAQWAAQACRLGAGEIVLNCMNADGTKAGYDLAQLLAVRSQVSVPLIASGGAGSVEDFVEALKICDAALAAGVFHRKELTIAQVKRALLSQGVRVRPLDAGNKGSSD